MATEIKLPEVGENITTGDVVRVLVKPGDVIEKDQPLLELETDKASFDVPSPVAGTVIRIDVTEGGKASVGSVIMVAEESSASSRAEDTTATPDTTEKVTTPLSMATTDDNKEKENSAAMQKQDEEQTEAFHVPALQTPESKSVVTRLPVAIPPAGTIKEQIPVPAAPSVRIFAREIGVDITAVPGSGPNGRISVDDVKAYAKSLFDSGIGSGTLHTATHRRQLPDFTAYGAVRREAMSKVRSKTAEQMELSWTIPAVTQHDKADITRLEELRRRFTKKAEAGGSKLTVTAIILKVIASALKKFPQCNASLDMENGDIVYKEYINLGVAVDTERGLLVPVIRDVDKKNILTISKELQELAEKARGRKIMPDEMSGAGFTITNLGGIGGTSFTPIINWPEVAILGVSRAAIEPIYIDGTFQPRLIMPLSLTYDHRIIDGADAARFMRWVVEALEEPLLLALEG